MPAITPSIPGITRYAPPLTSNPQPGPDSTVPGARKGPLAVTSLDNPEIIVAPEATIPDSDPVIGIEIEDLARAYPLGRLRTHELINDRLGKIPVMITASWDRNVIRIFDARCRGRILHGNLLAEFKEQGWFQDRETLTTWNQEDGKAVAGPLEGEHMTAIPYSRTTWGQWKKAHPATTVMRGEALSPTP